MTATFSRSMMALLLLTASGCAQSAKSPDSVDVRQLRIVNEKGTPQLVLTSDTRLADAPGSTRKVRGAALLFNDADGREVGGIGMIKKNVVICLDYPAKPAQGTEPAWPRSEAICIARDEEGVSSISVNDPAVPMNRSGIGNERISLSVDRGQSKIALNDKNGKPRIRLSVDANDVPRIEILDANGATVYTLPPTTKP